MEITSVMMEATWQWRNSKKTKENNKLHTHTGTQDKFAILRNNEKDRENLKQLYKSQNKKYVHMQASFQGQKG